MPPSPLSKVRREDDVLHPEQENKVCLHEPKYSDLFKAISQVLIIIIKGILK
jgi:hypothetical protein